MARKNNRKGNRKGNNNKKQAVTAKPSLSDSQKTDIDTIVDTVSEVEETTISVDEQKELTKLETEGGITKYWDKVKSIHRKNTTLSDKQASLQAELEDKQKAIEQRLSESKETIQAIEAKQADINKKDSELTEREFALDNGKYSTVIKNLLQQLKATEKEIFTDTTKTLQELSTFHKNSLTEFKESVDKSAELEKRENDLNRKLKQYEITREVHEEDVREELENEYRTELNKQSRKLKSYSTRLERLEQEKEELQNQIEEVESAFGNMRTDVILQRYDNLKEELSRLLSEVRNRPEKENYERIERLYAEQKRKNKELHEKHDERELLRLKAEFENQDSYILEINNYKSRLESADAREASLKQTQKEMRATIELMLEEQNKGKDAFEFAKWCDTNENLQTPLQITKLKSPKNLIELCMYLQRKIRTQGFSYDLETIRIFLAGLHMSPLTILQGISGTGKTSLPRELAKAMLDSSEFKGKYPDAKELKPAYRICAIQSGWRDNMDLMGHFNSFEKKYKETDFFKALYMAKQPKYKNTLFFIVLDEMNLSHPEHYFADFLSLLEQDDEDRIISLSNTPEESCPALAKNSKIEIPDNVRFIGTANHDETTLEFAPKTYDRANVLEMSSQQPTLKEQEHKEVFNVCYPYLKNQFNKSEEKHTEQVETFNMFLESKEFKELLEDKGIGIGYRLKKHAKRFISVFIDSGTKSPVDLAVAADHLITTRLFRTLKNRYDIEKAELDGFKEEYVSLFKSQFKQEPIKGIQLLEKEMKGKE